MWPVEGYTAQLTPWYNQAALNNSGNSYLLALGTTWNANNTVQQNSEGFGAAGTYSSLTFLYQNFNYDRLNRLLAVNDTNYSRGFNYDEFGNMSVSEYGTVMPSSLAPLSGGSRPNPYDPGTNRLVSNTFGYDVRGDLTTLGAMTITYDAEANQAKTVDSGTGLTISYAFDAEGQRVEKQTSGGATIIDVHDAFGRLAAEYNSAGVTPACTTCYLVYDGVGSVRLVTDQSGNIVARHDYLPFGDEIANGVAGRTGNFGFTTNITQGFTGQESDGGTGWLDYFNARHLSVAIGSFTQPDPMQAGADFLNPQSWNGYGYVLGNPLGLVDPSGLSAKDLPGDGGGSDDCYSPEYATPCNLPIGWGGWGGGGGCAPSGGGGGGGGSPSSGGGMTGSLPPGSFPGGENLGLPPGTSVPLPGLGVLLGQGNDCEFGVCSFTDYNQAQTSSLLNQAYLEATAGRILGLLNIFHNSTGKYDFGWNIHADDTWSLCGMTLDADHMANFIAGFEGAAYDHYYFWTTGAIWAQGAVEGGGILYHLVKTKAKHDPFDRTGMPDIIRGERLGRRWHGANTACGG